MLVLLYRHMTRTSVMLPPELKNRATRRARERGVSFGEFLREALGEALDSHSAEKKDILFCDNALFEGKVSPRLSAEHDRFLYGDR